MRNKINYAGPWITAKEVEYVNDAVVNGFYQNYKVHAQRLENKLCNYLGVKYALATNTCTAALHLAVASLEIKEGDEVITSDSSCVASALGIALTGATPVFVDVDPETWCLSPQAVRMAITPKTKAILPVHWNGHVAAMDEILAIARENKLYVIEDGAPSLGAEFHGKKAGTFGDVGCFSFQGAKVAIGGQGGVLVTDNADIIEKAKILASFGRTDSVMQYWSDMIGFNYTMPNLPAALALAQVERIDELLAKKREIFQQYYESLQSLKHVKLIKEPANSKSTYCYPAMRLEESAPISRDQLFTELKKDNIDSRPAQPRISQFPMFEKRFSNPQSEIVEKRGVILPSAFNLTSDDVSFVCQRLSRLIG